MFDVSGEQKLFRLAWVCHYHVSYFWKRLHFCNLSPTFLYSTFSIVFDEEGILQPCIKKWINYIIYDQLNTLPTLQISLYLLKKTFKSILTFILESLKGMFFEPLTVDI